jgi:large subunit ribosomal protein L25
MIKELQTHPVSRNFLHIDFYEIDMNRKIRVNVPVTTTGIAPGVELGGLLQIIRRELEVLCLPSEVPESIEIDISSLGMGESIHLSEISLKGNVEFPEDLNFTVVTILSPKVVEEEVEEVEEGEEEDTEEETAEAEGD